MSNGFFICIEGPDASGKTTQTLKLEETLKAKGYKVFRTREPGDSSIGSDVRRMVLSDRDVNLSPKTELMLLLADRIQHLEELVKPKLDQGHIVICDRYISSTIAYQGYGRGLDVSMVEQVCDWATDSLKPDLTFYLQADVETAKARLLERGAALDKMETTDVEFKERVIEGFEHCFQKEPTDKRRLIDPCFDIDETGDIILGKTMLSIYRKIRSSPCLI